MNMILATVIAMLATVTSFSQLGRLPSIGVAFKLQAPSGRRYLLNNGYFPVRMSDQDDAGSKKMKGYLKGSINDTKKSSLKAVEWLKALVIKIFKLTKDALYEAVRRTWSVVVVMTRMSIINAKDAIGWTTYFCGRALKNTAKAVLVYLFKLGVRSGLLSDSDDYDDPSEDTYGSALSVGKSTSDIISSNAALSAAAGSGRKYSTPASGSSSSIIGTKSEALPTPEEQYRMKIETDRKKVKDRMRELARKEDERKAAAQRVAAALASTLAEAETRTEAGVETDMPLPVIPSPSPSPVPAPAPAPITPAAAAVAAVQPEAVVTETSSSTKVELPPAPAPAPAPASASASVPNAMRSASKVEDSAEGAIDGVETGSGTNLEVPVSEMTEAATLGETDSTGKDRDNKQRELTLGEKIAKAGTAGTVSYVLTELGFWAISIPFIVSSYHSSTGEWLDLSNAEERVRIIGLTAGFVSTARLAVPLRLGFALFMTPTVNDVLTENKFLETETEAEAEAEADGEHSSP